ncbi:hypothetical protein NX88_11595, partial [Neisseria meningitidis]
MWSVVLFGLPAVRYNFVKYITKFQVFKLWIKNPTEELYKAFTKAYNFFNEELFKGELSPCMVTVARGKPYYGCFMPKRWKDNNGQLVHEISMN